MKSSVRHYTPVALLLAVILVVSSCLSLVTGRREQDDRPLVLATTYPLYVAAQNILGGTDAVRVEMLSGVGTGCLHDYQLSPADRLLLAEADLVLCNGVGAEPFLDGLVEESRRLNTSAGVAEEQLLCADHHHEEGEHHHEEEYNEHLWLSPTLYKQQVAALLEPLAQVGELEIGLCRENMAHYMNYIDYVWAQMPLAQLEGTPCVLFQDSLSYLARDLHLDVQMTLAVDGDSGIAAADLAAVERLAREYPNLILLYDTQYPIRYSGVDGLVAAEQVLALETAVTGEGDPHDWLSAMERNAQKLQTLVGGDTP